MNNAPSPERVFTSSADAQLARAVERGETACIEQLVTAGGNVNTRGDRGIGLLHWAVLHRSLDGLTKLLELGASATDEDETGLTVVHYAAGMDDPVFLEALIAAGVDLNVRNGANGETPIFTALMGDRKPQFNALLTAAAMGKVDLEMADRNGNTLLHQAAKVNDTGIVLELLQRGVNFATLNDQGVDFMRYLTATPVAFLDAPHRAQRAAIESLIRSYKSGP